MPTCSLCKQDKPNNDFYIDRRHKTGLASECKKCHGFFQKRWSINNKEKMIVYNKIYELQNKDKRKKQHQLKYLMNKGKMLANGKRWRKANPEKAREFSKKASTKTRSSLKGRLNCCMSSNLRIALKGNKAGRHWEALVGYSVEQLKNHLEKRFHSGMTWDNHGTYWEIDHKIPIAVFNFKNPNDMDFRLCWSLKNLQPLEKTINRRKSDKLEKPFQPSLALAIGG